MTEQEYIDGIKCYTREWKGMPDEARWLACRAVRAFPNCAELWLLHSKVVGGPEDGDCACLAVLASLERCIQLNPNLTEAYDELGGYWDGIRDDPEKAMEYYRKAAELRGESLV